jgi:hypothetical protein
MYSSGSVRNNNCDFNFERRLLWLRTRTIRKVMLRIAAKILPRAVARVLPGLVVKMIPVVLAKAETDR